MAYRKTSTKTTRKATLNIETSDKDKRKVRKTIKKMSSKALTLALSFLLIGGLGGVGAGYMITKDDCFTINGKDEITLTLSEHYVDEGVSVVAFGADDSDKVIIETDLKQDENGYYAESEGTYYIKYTVDNLKYGKIFKVQKIRLVTFVENTEDSEVNNG